MADDNTNDQGTGDQGTDKSAMDAFWAEFDTRIKGHLDGFYKDKIKEFRTKSTSRTENGRTTLPGIFASLMFGPEKKDS